MTKATQNDKDQETIEFEGSVVSQVVLIILAIVTTFGFWLVFKASDGLVDFAINGFVVLILGMGTYMMIDQYRPGGGPVVTLSPEGIRDRRVADNVIPWSAVQLIKPQRNIGSRSLVLTVDVGTIERVGAQRRDPFLPEGVRPAPASEVIQISGSGLKASFGTLRDACLEFANRYGSVKVS